MLENIAVSVSTVIFLLCSLIISSVLPDKGDTGSPPSEPLCSESVSGTVYEALPTAVSVDDFCLEGVWECFGHRYEFKSDGRLIAEGETLRWELSCGNVVINYDGEPHTLTLEPLGNRVMRLDGKTYYRISDS